MSDAGSAGIAASVERCDGRRDVGTGPCAGVPVPGERHLVCRAGSFVPAAPRWSTARPPLTAVAMVDCSTMTPTDLRDLRDDDDNSGSSGGCGGGSDGAEKRAADFSSTVDRLVALFAGVSVQCVSEVLSVCGGDADWAATVLLDVQADWSSGDAIGADTNNNSSSSTATAAAAPALDYQHVDTPPWPPQPSLVSTCSLTATATTAVTADTTAVSAATAASSSVTDSTVCQSAEVSGQTQAIAVSRSLRLSAHTRSNCCDSGCCLVCEVDGCAGHSSCRPALTSCDHLPPPAAALFAEPLPVAPATGTAGNETAGATTGKQLLMTDSYGLVGDSVASADNWTSCCNAAAPASRAAAAAFVCSPNAGAQSSCPPAVPVLQLQSGADCHTPPPAVAAAPNRCATPTDTSTAPSHVTLAEHAIEPDSNTSYTLTSSPQNSSSSCRQVALSTDSQPADASQQLLHEYSGQLQLPLSPLLVYQLQQLFGPSDQPRHSLEQLLSMPEQLFSVQLPAALAAQLLAVWQQSGTVRGWLSDCDASAANRDADSRLMTTLRLLEQQDDEGEVAMGMIGDRVEPEWLVSSERRRAPAVPLLSTIIEHQLCQQARHSARQCGDSLSDRLTLQRLSSAYPRLDTAHLHRLYNQHGGHYPSLCQHLAQLFGEPAPAALTLAADSGAVTTTTTTAAAASACATVPASVANMTCNSGVVDDSDAVDTEAEIAACRRHIALARDAMRSPACRQSPVIFSRFARQVARLHSRIRECQLRDTLYSSQPLPVSLDLHLLSVPAALSLLAEFVQLHRTALINRGVAAIKCDVITGHGAHSERGRARVKTATISWLRAKRIRFEEPYNNTGMLIIVIRSGL